MLELSDFINISVNQAPTGLGDFLVNNVALFTADPFLSNPNSDVYRIYVSSAAVGTDFGTTTETYKQAVAFFSQAPNPLNGGGCLIIFPFLQGVISTINATPTAGGSGYVVGDILTISTGGTGGTVTVAAVSGGAVTSLTLTTGGKNYTSGSGKSTTGGTGTGCTVNITAIKQEDLIDAVNRTKDFIFYCGILATTYPVSGSMKSVADSIQALGDKILMLPSATYSDVAGAFTNIKNAKDNNTRCLYYSTAALDARLFAAAYAGAGFSTNFDASKSTLTMQFKQLATILPDDGITETIRAAVLAAGVDVYTSIAGFPATVTSGENNYFDTVIGLIWFVNALKVAGFNALAQTNTKIPQTEEGVSVLKTAYRQVCAAAVNNRFVAPGTWTSPDTFGNQTDFLDNVKNVGYYIYSQPVSEQSSTDRAARKAPLIQIAIKLAGAIHSSTVVVNVNP